jgi:hypothetical protein
VSLNKITRKFSMRLLSVKEVWESIGFVIWNFYFKFTVVMKVLVSGFGSNPHFCVFRLFFFFKTSVFQVSNILVQKELL